MFHDKKIETINFSEFMSGEYKEEVDVRTKVLRHMEEYEMMYRTVGLAVLLTVGVTDVGFAADAGIDAKARELYHELVGYVKWIIAGKGAWDTGNKALQGDFEGAKKYFLQYGLVFALLLSYPWLLDKIESLLGRVQ